MDWRAIFLQGLCYWVAPIVCGSFLIFRLRYRAKTALPSYKWLLLLFFLLSRIVYLPVLYDIAGHPPNEDVRYWQEAASQVLEGSVPGRDFRNGYGPLFFYLLAPGVFVFGTESSLGVMLPLLLGEFLVVFFGARLTGILLGPKDALWAGIWLLLNPLLWHQTVVDAQHQTLFLGMLVLSVYLLAGNHGRWAMITLALGFCATKITYGPYALAVLCAASEMRLRSLISTWTPFLATCAVIYVPYMASGADPLAFIGHPGVWLSPYWYNISLLVYLATPELARLLGYGLYGTCTSLAAAWAAQRTHTLSCAWRCVITLAAVHAVSMLVQPFCVTEYMTQGLVFLLLFGQ